MTETPAPDAAEAIANEALGTVDNRDARTVVTALDAAGWLHDPAEIERLRGELAAAESTIAVLEDPELRVALSEPTTGDYGPVPAPKDDR